MMKKTILKGTPASVGVVKGRAKVLTSYKDINKVSSGDIIVTPLTNPLYTPAILIASAIVTEVGGILCHAAIVSREAGIPCVVAVKKATKIIKDNQIIEVDGKNGIVKILTSDN